MAETLSDKLRRMEAGPGVAPEEKRLSVADALRVVGAEEPEEDTGFGGNLIGTFMAIANRMPTPFQAFNENVSVGDFATGASNIPGQAVDISKSVGSGVATGVSDLMAGQPLRSIGEGVRKTASGVGNAFRQDPLAAAGAIGSAILPTRDRIREDPLGVLFDASAVAVGPGRLLNKAMGAAEDIGDVARVAEAAKTFKLAKAPADLARITNPISVVAKVAGKTIEKTGEWIHDAILRGASNKSGLPTDVINIAEESAKAGGVGSKAFKNAYEKAIKEGGETVVLRDVAPKFQQAINEADEWASLKYDKWLGDAGYIDKNNPINMDNVRQVVHEKLASEGWKISLDGEGRLIASAPVEFRNSPAEVGRITEMLETLHEWTDPSIRETMGRKKSLVPLLDLGPTRDSFKQSNRLVGEAFGAIDNELRTKVRDYSQATDSYRAMSEYISRTRKALGLRKNDDALRMIGIFGDESNLIAVNETFLTKIGNLMNDRRSMNLGLREAFVKELDRVLTAGLLRDEGYDVMRLTGKEIDEIAKSKGIKSTLFEEIAGAIAGDPATQGAARMSGNAGGATAAMVGMGIGGQMGGYLGATMGGSAGLAVGKMINNMTIRNPRAVSYFFRSLGMAEGQADKIRQVFDIAKKGAGVGNVALGAGAAEGMTFGVAMDRIKSRTQDKLKVKKLLSDVGIDLEDL